MGSEFNIKINRYKLNHLFKNIRKLNGGRGLIARKLGITPATFDEYLKTGKEYLDKFADKLMPIYEIDIDTLEENIDSTKSEYLDEFLQNNGDNVLSDKNKNAFEVYFYDIREKQKENIIYQFQKEIIENIKWSDNDKENEKIEILMLFALIYERGQLSLDEELLYLKNRYSKSSSKHVGIIVKDLERRNKEDFGEIPKQQEQKQITVNQQFNNFTHYSVEYEKSMGLLKADKNNNDNVIDVIPTKIDDD